MDEFVELVDGMRRRGGHRHGRLFAETLIGGWTAAGAQRAGTAGRVWGVETELARAVAPPDLDGLELVDLTVRAHEPVLRVPPPARPALQVLFPIQGVERLSKRNARFLSGAPRHRVAGLGS